MRLEAGARAPAFTLPSAAGPEVSLIDFIGRRVILYCYPAAMTPGCTKQARDFRDNLALFDNNGFTVIGVSPDHPAQLVKFREQEALPFTLLADPGHFVMEQYGAWGQKMLYGKAVTGVIRSTFIISPTGEIEAAQYGVKATGHVARLIRDLHLI